MILRFGVVVGLAVMLPCLASAHPANMPAALIKVAGDGSIKLRLHCDILAYVLDSTPVDISDEPMNALLDGPPADLQARLNEARTRFIQQMALKSAKRGLKIDHVVFPTAAEIAAFVKAGTKNRLPVMMTITAEATLPAGSRSLSVVFPEVLSTVILTTEVANKEPISEPVEPGNASSTVSVPVVKARH